MLSNDSYSQLTGFEDVHVSNEELEQSRIESLERMRLGKQDATTNIELFKNQVTQAKSLLMTLRSNARYHMDNPDFKNLGLEEVFAASDDVRNRVEAHDKSKPAKRLGPVDDVPAAKKTVVDTLQGVRTLIGQITNSPNVHAPSPRIFINGVGDNLGRNGEMTMLIIYLPEIAEVFFVDILTIGPGTFSTYDVEAGYSLGGILADQQIVKAFWDGRSNSDALFAHFDIKLAAVVEVQLLDIATKKSSKEKESKRQPKLPSLELSFTARLNVTEAAQGRIHDTENWGVQGAVEGMAEMKRRHAREYAVEKGEEWQRAEEDDVSKRVEQGLALPACYSRPIEEVMKQCWAQKVLLLPALHKHLTGHSKYTEETAKEVADETDKRLELSRSPEWTYEDHSELPEYWRPKKESVKVKVVEASDYI